MVVYQASLHAKATPEDSPVSLLSKFVAVPDQTYPAVVFIFSLGHIAKE